jgi:hypothetical protein
MVLRALDNTAYDDYVRLSNTNLGKTYGDANPALSGITLDGVGTNNATLDWGNAITTTTNAGTYAYGTPNVLSVTSNNGRSVYVEYGRGALTINKAPLTVTANDATKTYDGQAFTGGNDVTYSGFVNNDNDSALSGALSYGGTAQGAKNAGSYTITASGLTAQNYDITYVDGALTVNKATISGITGITANKTYDGTTAATLNTAHAAFTGMVAGDNLTVATAAGAFTDKNAGTGKTVNISGMSLGGADADNYTLATTTAKITADITRATISGITGITAANKTYDGTTAATLNTAHAAFTGMIPGDSLNIATAAGNFADAIPGVNKTVFITGLSLGGADAGNYALTNTTETTTAYISAIAAPWSSQQNAIGRSTLVAPASTILSSGVELIDAGAMSVGEGKTTNSPACTPGSNQGGASQCVP